jgi:hypothetical protein
MSEALNKVSDEIKKLGQIVEASLTYDDDGAAVLPETFVKDNLEEGLDLDLIKRVQNTEATFAGALALGLGNSSRQRMQDKPDLERTSVSLDFGNNTIRASVDRKVMVRAPGATEERAKYGNVSVKLDSGAAAKRGDLKRVITHVNDTFAAAFDK